MFCYVVPVYRGVEGGKCEIAPHIFAPNLTRVRHARTLTGIYTLYCISEQCNSSSHAHCEKQSLHFDNNYSHLRWLGSARNICDREVKVRVCHLSQYLLKACTLVTISTSFLHCCKAVSLLFSSSLSVFCATFDSSVMHLLALEPKKVTKMYQFKILL